MNAACATCVGPPISAMVFLLVGVFFPLSQMPAWLQTLVHGLPPTAAVEIMRPLVLGHWPEHGVRDGLLLVTNGLMSYYIAVLLARRRYSSEVKMDEVLIVLTSCPDAACAERIGRSLVEQGLAACVNQFAPVVSCYRWQDEIECATEVPLQIKTTRSRYPELEAALRALHPYEVPEIVALPVAVGYGPYLRWVAAAVMPPLRA
ncbi:MAG: divalent cation tolerance protein CutA [Burkholderiaceae bacterium]